jgi:hypothetical protein
MIPTAKQAVSAVVMFLAVFLPLWLSGAEGPGWDALWAALLPALRQAVLMLLARRAQNAGAK